MSKNIENNQATILGEITKPFEFSHNVFGEGFYVTEISIKRLSGMKDYIPVMVSERLVDVTGDLTGAFIRAEGEFRSYNRYEEEKNKLELFVFARELEFVDEEVKNANKNWIFLDGFVCKPPVYRETYSGREITDLLIAVNRPYGKTDYIPCICWGRNAIFSSGFEVGTHLQLCGRIQSKEYVKRFENGAQEVRIAYEVSVSRIDVIEEKGC